MTILIPPKILKLDTNGFPCEWIQAKEAIKYYAEDQIAWEYGDKVCTFHGGISRITQERSELTTASIIAVKGAFVKTNEMNKTPALDNDSLFLRDRHVCAYCGHVYPSSKLSREHIIPTSKGGKDIWMNVVTACKVCNNRKSNKTLSESGMELLYAPYIPNRYEYLILQNRRILEDQMDYLIAKVTSQSRLLDHNQI